MKTKEITQKIITFVSGSKATQVILAFVFLVGFGVLVSAVFGG